VTRKELVATAVIHKAEILNTEKYLNIIYKGEQFLNIVKSDYINRT